METFDQAFVGYFLFIVFNGKIHMVLDDAKLKFIEGLFESKEEIMGRVHPKIYFMVYFRCIR